MDQATMGSFVTNLVSMSSYDFDNDDLLAHGFGTHKFFHTYLLKSIVSASMDLARKGSIMDPVMRGSPMELVVSSFLGYNHPFSE